MDIISALISNADPGHLCATGRRTLASKSLIERLDDDDAAALGVELDRVGYSILEDFPTASENAHGDAPAIAVCEL